MANEKFTQLPTVTNSTLADIIAAVQGGVSVQQTLSQVLSLVQSNLVQHFAGDPNGNLAGSVYGLCWDTTNEVLYVCTTSGTSTTAVWTLAGSVMFPIALADGGTGKSLTASAGGIVWCDASSMEILAGIASSNHALLSGNLATPTWSATTYPDSTTINQILYSPSNDVVSGLPTVNSGVLVTDNSGVPTWLSSLTNGQMIIGSTGNIPVATTLTAGSNISIINAPGSVTISASGFAGFSWHVVTGTSQNMSSNNGYIANNAGLVTLNMPASSSVGDEIDIVGKGAGGWLVQCGVGQTIVFGNTTTSSGGSLASTNAKDSLYMICTVANTEWTIPSAPQGIITVA